ncbi:MAG: hypothetical protein Q7U52_16740, partial [Hydrogenophaga sp.]|nr:hypothetical protein [Hydrogenophaga sp.]MDO9606662.1 hypothetical protein [Hydrogenophaga sp.]
MKWANVDFQWRKLTIADKAEDTRTIPLSPYLTQLLATLPRSNEFVFASTGVSGGLNPRKSGGGKWWRNMVTESGGHLWRRILVAAFGAECATNSKG